MIKPSLQLLILIFCSSCATLFNTKTHELKLASKTENAQVQIKDSIYNLPTKIKVERSKEPLNLKFISDTHKVDYQIGPKLTKNFVYGNLLFLYFSPIGYSVDYTNHKRFHYGKSVLIDNDTINITYELKRKKRAKVFKETNKGNLFVNASIPYFNNFHMRPENVIPESNSGFFGISLGADYYYKKKNFINLTYSQNLIFETPFPAPISYDSDHEHNQTSAFLLSNNHVFNRFSVGYGLSYINYKWSLHKESEFDSENNQITKADNITKKHVALGFTFPAYYRLNKMLYLGVIYSPTFYTPNSVNKFTYEHVISLDVKVKFRIKK